MSSQQSAPTPRHARRQEQSGTALKLFARRRTGRHLVAPDGAQLIPRSGSGIIGQSIRHGVGKSNATRSDRGKSAGVLQEELNAPRIERQQSEPFLVPQA